MYTISVYYIKIFHFKIGLKIRWIPNPRPEPDNWVQINLKHFHPKH